MAELHISGWGGAGYSGEGPLTLLSPLSMGNGNRSSSGDFLQAGTDELKVVADWLEGQCYDV